MEEAEKDRVTWKIHASPVCLELRREFWALGAAPRAPPGLRASARAAVSAWNARGSLLSSLCLNSRVPSVPCYFQLSALSPHSPSFFIVFTTAAEEGSLTTG